MSEAFKYLAQSVARELVETRTLRDLAHAKLAETRRSLVYAWMDVADTLHAQGELTLAHSVRRFANDLPPVRTERERLAAKLIAHLKGQRPGHTKEDDSVRDRTQERTR